MSGQKRHDTRRASLKRVAAWPIGSDASSIRVHLNAASLKLRNPEGHWRSTPSNHARVFGHLIGLGVFGFVRQQGCHSPPDRDRLLCSHTRIPGCRRRRRQRWLPAPSEVNPRPKWVTLADAAMASLMFKRGKRDASSSMSDLCGKSPALSSASNAMLVTSSWEVSNAASSQRRVQFWRATISGSSRALK